MTVTPRQAIIERELGSLAFHSGAAGYLRDFLHLLHPDDAALLIAQLGLSDVLTDIAALEVHAADTNNPHAVTKAQVGLANADNTSDVNKPISTLTQAALDLKAPLDSPTFTGTVAVPSPIDGDETTKPATTAFMYTRLNERVVADRTALLALNTAADWANLGEGSRCGLFERVTSSVASSISLLSVTTTTVDSGTETCTKTAHGMFTGQAGFSTTAVNGLSLNTIYFVIRVDADNFKLATTLANARLGTAINLTGTTNFTFKTHVDPTQGIYVLPTADISGASGGWIRRFDGYVNGRMFGSTGDGVTDDANALQAFLNYTFSNGLGGRAEILDGQYILGASLKIGGAGAFEGAGVTFEGESRSSTILTPTHSQGPAVEIAKPFCQLNNMTIQASSARTNGSETDSGGKRNVGLLVNSGAFDCSFHDVRVNNQPSDGWLIIGTAQRLFLNSVGATSNKGKGICLDGGERYGLSGASPGLVSIMQAVCNTNGGEGVSVGAPSGSAGLNGLRILLDQVDADGNATDAAQYYGQHQIWLRGAGCVVTRCGLSGGGSSTAYGLAVGGSNIYALTNRFHSMLGDTKAIDVLDFATENVVIDGVDIEPGTGTVTNAVVVESGCDQDSVRVRNVTGATNPVSPAIVLKAQPYILAQSSAAVAHTGSTSETTLASVTLPATGMGSNGRIRIKGYATYTNSANDKTIIVKFGGTGGTAYLSRLETTTAAMEFEVVISNRNATNSQHGWAKSLVGATPTLAATTSAVDTTADVSILIRGTLENSGETITLESYMIEVLPDG